MKRMPHSCTVVIIFGLLFLLNYPASTNALFNKKNVENDNSKNKKNELATQVQVERQKFIEDASTGTITELHPGMEKKPVTCNEIMAKAVVEANEQRSEALMDRDLALKEARDANKSKDKYEKDMNSAIEAKKKMEAQVKVIKKDAADRIEASRTKAENKIQEANESAATAIQTAKEDADQIVAQTKSDANSQIVAAETNAEENIADVKSQMTQLERETEAKILKVLEETNSNIESITEQAEKKVSDVHKQMEQLQVETLEKIDTVKKNTAAEVKEMEEKTAESIKDVHEQMAMVKKEAKTEIKNVEAKAAKVVVEIQNQMSDLEMATDKKIEDIIQDTEDEVLRTRDLAKFSIEEAERVNAKRLADIQNEMQLLQVKTNETIANIQLEATTEIENTNEKAELLKQTKDSEISALQKESKRLQGIIESLEETRHELQANLSVTTKNLYNLENEEKPYVNFTLIRQDSSQLLSLAQSKASVQYKEAATVTKSIASEYVYKAVNVTAPYREVVWEKYEETIKDTVDESILPVVIPFYNEKLIPLMNVCKLQALKALNKVSIQANKAYHLAHLYIASKIKESSNSALIYISENNNEGYVPTFVKDLLNYGYSDPETFEDDIINAALIISVYALRWHILRFVLFLVLLPARILWFFCPLRLLFRKKKKKAKRPASASSMTEARDENPDITRNGHKKAKVKRERRQ